MGCSQPLETPRNIISATIRPSGSGPMRESSGPSTPQEASVATNSRNVRNPKRPITVTAGSVPQSNTMTSNDRSSPCGPSSQDTESSPTSVPESTGNVRALKPFWNPRCTELADVLWLPTETVSPVLASNSSSGSFEPTEPTSWFNTKTWTPHRQQSSQKTSSQSPLFSPANITGSVAMPKKAMISRKVEIFPNVKDAMVLKRWCGLYRRMYNLAIEKMLDTGRWHWKGHKVLTTYDNIPKNEKVRLLPTNIRKEAYREASTAMAKAPHKNTVKFKTLKRNGRSLRVFGAVSIVDTPDGKRIKLTDSQKHKQLSKELIGFDQKNLADIRIGSSSQIVYDGKWWLLSPFEVERSNVPKKHAVALDPGVRTFQTTYSPDGTSKKLGDQASCRIFRLMKYIDKLAVFKDKRTRGKRLRLERRVGNLVDEMHWKIARELATDYDTIIIPPFETQKMAKKWKNGRYRKINKTAVRMMLRLAHYRFRERLIHVANKLGTRVVICTEEYTSKTCGNCGVVNADLGSAKKFKCPRCHIHVDRDGNGARNILIKSVCC
ncbi:hypothetical protein AR158_C068R [Paramecium bursaria Chlorella virus AR158]|uniref:transposase n=1 Tax=Paramecium bursaria Chlorella virus AR158 TaxID=380598 RepID=UPI00015AA777|nr:transposase [Paramecium bursaria Chlorella virus AR158]ABU43614.1 hypothetical protein AR158_C068R [Paramecium bursaria Chlorella virus AR158]